MPKEIYTIEHKTYPRQVRGLAEHFAKFHRYDDAIMIVNDAIPKDTYAIIHTVDRSKVDNMYAIDEVYDTNNNELLLDNILNNKSSYIFATDLTGELLSMVMRYCTENRISLISCTIID